MQDRTKTIHAVEKSLSDHFKDFIWDDLIDNTPDLTKEEKDWAKTSPAKLAMHMRDFVDRVIGIRS